MGYTNMNHSDSQRLHSLDAVRGFALLLGVAFHAALSFIPGLPPGFWAMNDHSPSAFLADASFVSHVFRMSLFFFIAGFFGRLLHQKLGTAGFWSNRAARIALPLVIFWLLLTPVIGFVWQTGLAKVFGGAPPAMPAMPTIPGFFMLTHLWFLYQLLWLYAAVLLLRALVARLDPAQKLRGLVDRVVSGSLRAPVAVFTLGIPLAAALVAIPMYFYGQGIPTPDMSLIPQVPATVGYGTAFVFGWLVHRSPDLLTVLARRWWLHLAIGMAATAYLLSVVHASPMAQPGFTRNAFSYLFGVAVWGWTLGLTGAALRFLSGYSATRRYIADASYWIYIAHLPVVAALQVWVGHWNLHWGVKYPFILVVSFAVLFASYHLLVRSTPIGVLLNGRRHPWRKPSDNPSPTSPNPPAPTNRPAGTDGPGPVAELRGVTKKFGAITALSGIDIEVRPGELLAVLGPNGAGKSTAISLWLGLQEADGGDVRLLGGSPQESNRRQGLGVMMQDVELPKELRVRELVRLASSYYSDPLPVEETLRRAGVTAIADRMYGKLSGGQKRLAQFAMAICGQPRVLFLDEPSVGLDTQAREALWNSVRGLLAAGCSIVLTTHYLEEAEALANRVTVISKGSVIATGSVDDMRALVARRQISCETTIPLEDIRAWPGVAEARMDRGRMLISSTDAEAVVRRLLASDARLGRLEVRQAGLNEAFNELTKNEITQEAA
jgi:ABC-type multidrug transport system ATPase subunit/peptidoglycan/LPS O-acetylase OafA/YrhL